MRGDRTGTGDAVLDATLDAYYDVTGDHALGHISNPTPTQARWAFADSYVALSLTEARGHASQMLAEARARVHPPTGPGRGLFQKLIDDTNAGRR